MKNVEKFWRGKLDGEEQENSKTFWFPVEEIQTVINKDRTRINIFIIIIWFHFVSKEPTIDPCGTPIFLFF